MTSKDVFGTISLSVPGLTDERSVFKFSKLAILSSEFGSASRRAAISLEADILLFDSLQVARQKKILS